VAFHVRDPKTDALVRELARKRGIGITEAIREAVEQALEADSSKTPREERIADLRARLQPLLDRIDAMPRSNVVLDKRFYDELWGQEDDD
jgi:antitoxin VapB